MDFFTEKQQGEIERSEKRLADRRSGRSARCSRQPVSLLRVDAIQRNLSCQRGVTTAEKGVAL